MLWISLFVFHIIDSLWVYIDICPRFYYLLLHVCAWPIVINRWRTSAHVSINWFKLSTNIVCVYLKLNRQNSGDSDALRNSPSCHEWSKPKPRISIVKSNIQILKFTCWEIIPFVFILLLAIVALSMWVCKEIAYLFVYILIGLIRSKSICLHNQEIYLSISHSKRDVTKFTCLFYFNWRTYLTNVCLYLISILNKKMYNLLVNKQRK